LVKYIIIIMHCAASNRVLTTRM